MGKNLVLTFFSIFIQKYQSFGCQVFIKYPVFFFKNNLLFNMFMCQKICVIKKKMPFLQCKQTDKFFIVKV